MTIHSTHIASTLSATPTFKKCWTTYIQSPKAWRALHTRLLTCTVVSLVTQIDRFQRTHACRFQAERDISRGISQAGLSSFLGTGATLAVAGTIVADMQLTNAVLAKTDEAALFASGVRPFGLAITHILPHLYDLPMVTRLLTACHLSWNVDSANPELAQLCFGTWRTEKQLYNVPETVAAMAKVIIAVRLPHRVQAAEVSAFLDTPEAHIHDSIQQIMAMGPTLSLLCSLCARHLSDGMLAERFAQSELSLNLNPVKQQQSLMSLALARLSGEQHEEKEEYAHKQ